MLLLHVFFFPKIGWRGAKGKFFRYFSRENLFYKSLPKRCCISKKKTERLLKKVGASPKKRRSVFKKRTQHYLNKVERQGDMAMYEGLYPEIRFIGFKRALIQEKPYHPPKTLVCNNLNQKLNFLIRVSFYILSPIKKVIPGHCYRKKREIKVL
jgi:hypothetical protein